MNSRKAGKIETSSSTPMTSICVVRPTLSEIMPAIGASTTSEDCAASAEKKPTEGGRLSVFTT